MVEKTKQMCSRVGCYALKDFESKFCAKHECKKCYGVGRVEPSFGVRVLCPQCNGSGEARG